MPNIYVQMQDLQIYLLTSGKKKLVIENIEKKKTRTKAVFMYGKKWFNFSENIQTCLNIFRLKQNKTNTALTPYLPPDTATCSIPFTAKLQNIAYNVSISSPLVSLLPTAIWLQCSLKFLLSVITNNLHATIYNGYFSIVILASQ